MNFCIRISTPFIASIPREKQLSYSFTITLLIFWHLTILNPFGILCKVWFSTIFCLFSFVVGWFNNFLLGFGFVFGVELSTIVTIVVDYGSMIAFPFMTYLIFPWVESKFVVTLSTISSPIFATLNRANTLFLKFRVSESFFMLYMILTTFTDGHLFESLIRMMIWLGSFLLYLIMPFMKASGIAFVFPQSSKKN